MAVPGEERSSTQSSRGEVRALTEEWQSSQEEVLTQARVCAVPEGACAKRLSASVLVVLGGVGAVEAREVGGVLGEAGGGFDCDEATEREGAGSPERRGRAYAELPGGGAKAPLAECVELSGRGAHAAR